MDEQLKDSYCSFAIFEVQNWDEQVSWRLDFFRGTITNYRSSRVVLVNNRSGG